MLRLLFALLIAFQPPIALAGGRGGHSTTFDPNSYGGGWTCFRSQASGACGSGPFFQYLNAACDGTTDDTAALSAWLTYAHGLGEALAKINTGDGSKCHFPGNSSFAADLSINCQGFGSSPNTTVQNLLVWQYGSAFDAERFGAGAFYSVQNPNGIQTGCSGAPTNTSPLIQAANAGDITVTLITAAEAANFVIDDWILVTALANTTIGNIPPSHSFHEHKLITAIDAGAGILTLNSPLQFSYKATYPNLGGTQPFQGGPATIYLMQKIYNTNAQYFGGTITSIPLTYLIGRSVVIHDVTLSDPSSFGISPTQSEAVWVIRSNYPTAEVDKEIGLLAIINSSVSTMDFQSSSINNLIIQGTAFSHTLNGISANASISNSKINAIRAGPLCCGQGASLSLDGVKVTTANANYHHTLISAYSFSAGTLTIAKANAEYTNGISPGIWVPGHKYFVGDSDGSNTCSPANTFTALSVDDAGANVNIVTDLASVSFGNTCGAGTRPPTTFGAYQAMTLQQLNVPAGSANLLSNPEMLPP